jgi:flagellar hook assembly protein FlgD
VDPRGALLESAPNPFRPSTEIRFRLPRPAHVQLAIYDAAGRLVRTLIDAVLQTGGEHSVQWEGTDASGRRVPPGVYFYRLVTPDFTRARKLTVAR